MNTAENKHPDGLPFPPEGMGWTAKGETKPSGERVRLLTEHNIASVSRNHAEEWEAALNAIEPGKRDKRGRPTGFDDDERRRLATLAILVEKGVVQ